MFNLQSFFNNLRMPAFTLPPLPALTGPIFSQANWPTLPPLNGTVSTQSSSSNGDLSLDVRDGVAHIRYDASRYAPDSLKLSLDGGGQLTATLGNASSSVTLGGANTPANVDVTGAHGSAAMAAFRGNGLYYQAGMAGGSRNGSGSDDTMVGGMGSDTFHGGAGHDRLSGGMGNDALYGGAGDDLLDGGMGDDRVEGGIGNDRLLGGMGNDVLQGGAGHDRLFGDMGHDTLAGGQGNDVLQGGLGNDRLQGGLGNDTYVFGARFGRDVIENGDAAGRDVVAFDAQSGLKAADLWFSREGNDLVVDALRAGPDATVYVNGERRTVSATTEGSGDRLTVRDWFASDAAKVDAFQDASGLGLSQNRVGHLVEAMAAFGAKPASSHALTAPQRQQLDAVIAANWA